MGVDGVLESMISCCLQVLVEPVHTLVLGWRTGVVDFFGILNGRYMGPKVNMLYKTDDE